MKNKLFLAAMAALMLLGAPQRGEGAGNPERLIYIPGGECLNYGEYNMSFRVYNYGGMLTRSVFGVLQGMNIGFSWDIANLIGSETIHGRNPELYLKLDLFRESALMPAVALGYDAQGYEWNSVDKKYSTDPIGVFLVMSKELVLPDMYVTAGTNYDTKDHNPDHDFTDKLKGFAGFSFQPSKFGLYYEAINVGKGRNLCRMNAGAKYEVVEGLQFKLSFENISEAGRIELNKEQQRTFSILYKGAF
ncbi:MAG: hypothetical protein U9O97_07565 [Elusimicrobiota bacterium]|nr:hypothetical protein [Elusimicrobiota bacterium]